MNYKEGLKCALDLLGTPVENQQESFIKYLYEAASEIANFLDICKDCIEGKLKPTACKIDLPNPETIKSVSVGQVTIGSFDLDPRPLAEVRALKKAWGQPSYYSWDCAKPESLHFGPMVRKRKDYLVEVVRTYLPDDCDKEIFDGKMKHLQHLVYEKAAYKIAFSCEEYELGAVLNQQYQASLSTALQSMGVPSVVEQLKSTAKVDAQNSATLGNLI